MTCYRTPKDIQAIFEILALQHPAPVTELYYKNAFTLLSAILLSAQMTDKGVNNVTKQLFETLQTPQDVLSFGLEALTESIRSINLYKTKAKHWYQTALIIQEEYQGSVPQQLEDLLRLPGVGRKTALVFLNVFCEQETFPVDTHAFRVSHRLGLSDGKTPLAVEKDLNLHVPKPYRVLAHHWIILHGRYTCKARRPKCDVCSLNELCSAADKQEVSLE